MKRMFIVGCPRSGTTWTALLFAQHPEIQACQQIGAISSLHKFFLYWERGEVHTRYHSSAIKFGSGKTDDVATPQYVPLMTRAQFVDVSRNMLDQVYGYAAAMRPGCRAVVDSTPENVVTPHLLAELMPDAYYLHIVRDPRAVFASHRKATEDFGARFPSDAEGSARFWRDHVMKGRELGALVPNYRELRYETLKKDGPAELQKVLEWLGVTADPAWCERVIARTSVEKLQGTPGTPKSFFRSGKAAGWKDELSQSELHTVEYHARSLMLELGYEPMHPHSDRKTIGMRARGAAQRIAGGLRKALGAR